MLSSCFKGSNIYDIQILLLNNTLSVTIADASQIEKSGKKKKASRFSRDLKGFLSFFFSYVDSMMTYIHFYLNLKINLAKYTNKYDKQTIYC